MAHGVLWLVSTAASYPSRLEWDVHRRMFSVSGWRSPHTHTNPHAHIFAAW